MKTKLSSKFWLVLTLFSLIGQVAWVIENMFLNVFIYNMFGANSKAIATMVAASAIAATLTTVFIGALSDKLGKRKIFMCGGYIVWGVSILGFALVRMDIIAPIVPATMDAAAVAVSIVIALDCIMTFFGSSANDAAFNAWLTDSTDDTNRGSAEGINAMMPLVAILVVFGGKMVLEMFCPDKTPAFWTIFFAIIGAIVFVVGILGIFIIKDPDIKPSETGFWKNTIHGFLPSTMKQNVPFYVSLVCFILFNISIQIFMPYLMIYYEHSLKMADYVLIMAPAIIIASIVTAFWGKVYDKKGFKFSSAISFVWLCLGYIVLFIFTGKALVFVGSLLMMCGFLAGMAVFGAKVRDLTPEGKAGMFQGVRIFAQVLVPGVVGPAIGSMILRNAERIEINGQITEIPNNNIFLGALIAAIIAIIVMIVCGKHINRSKKPVELNKNLVTPFESDDSSSWDEYPRPQFKRDSYLCLNGEWDLFSSLHGNVTHLGKIKVPFTPETRLSGINREKQDNEVYIYRRNVNFDVDFIKGREILHFGAVDQKCHVYFNDNYLGEHVGGYLPFSFDVTEHAIIGENKLEVVVIDELDRELAYGKQRKDRGGMWYTPTSGIWQTVWCESVPNDYVKGIKVTPRFDGALFEIDAPECEKTLVLGDKEYKFKGNTFDLKLEDPIHWTPDNPHLYEFTLICGEDRVESYFACRTVDIEERCGKSFICLNGRPILCHGLLDQGYYSDGIYLPATPEGYKYDILTMKKLGFNMLRKHIKIEPQLFYYYCDKYGMLVFQDMVNSGKYSFFVDTALPTVGFKRGITHKASKQRREAFENDSRATIDLLYNHPSVIYYTIFNEGWGQFDADENYLALKAYDPTRVYDSTSGWFWEKHSDVHSEHIYMRKLKLKARAGRPLILSEFGGYSCKLPEHSFNLDNTYGYSANNGPEDFEKKFIKLYDEQVIPYIKKAGLCGLVYTQVSDVEDETNGLFTYDRQILKVDVEPVKAMSDRLYEAFEEAIK